MRRRRWAWVVAVVTIVTVAMRGCGMGALCEAGAAGDKGDDALQRALERLFPSPPAPGAPAQSFGDSPTASGISRRCSGYLACEFHVPVAELRNVTVHNGVVHVLAKANETMTSWLPQLHGAKAGHLPSCLVQVAYGSPDFVAGPAIRFSPPTSAPSPVCGADARAASALFLFPWEPHNAYHTLNDNVLALLASSLLQFVTTAPVQRRELALRTLYRFKAFAPKSACSLFDTISLLYPRSESARSLLSGGPHCVTRMTWGAQMKPFYRDSLSLLRFRLYDLLRLTLADTLRLPALTTTRRPRVVIVTRNGGPAGAGAGAGASPRRLSDATEQALVRAFQQFGADASICCNFESLDTPGFVSRFWEADICVGVHGAGLANCALGPRGLVVAELQVAHNFGFDSFMKVAHMARGSYLFLDARAHAQAQGVVLPAETTLQFAELAVATWRQSQQDLPQVEARSAGDALLASPPGSRLEAGAGAEGHDRGAPQTPADRAGVLQRMYAGEVVVDAQSRVVYADDATLVRRLGLDQWHLQPRAARSAPGGREFWIFPNPFVHSGGEGESIFGPPMHKVYERCVSLPYFKFRFMTQPHVARALECDRSVIVTRRSGRNDHKLLTSDLLP